MQRPRGHEARQLTLASDTVEECNTLRLCAEHQLAPRGSLERELHEVLADPAPLIFGIDEKFGNGGEKIAIRQNANAADEAGAVPGTNVMVRSRAARASGTE